MPRSSPSPLRVPAPGVRARPFVPEDLPDLLALIDRNRSRFRENGLGPLPQTLDDVTAWAAGDARHHERMVGVFDDDRCVGFVGVLTIRLATMATPGMGVWYGLDQACEGRGVATEGVRQALQGYARQRANETPSLTMVHCRITNRRSARLAQRLGLQRDPSIDYVRYDGGRSAPRMVGFSRPTDELLAWLRSESDVAPSLQNDPGKRSGRSPRKAP